MRIAVTPRSLSADGHSALDMLTQKGYQLVFPDPGRMPSAERLAKTIPGCVGWLAGVEPITESTLEQAVGLKVISRNGSGIDNIALHAAERLEITVKRTIGANARGVAELAIGLMLCGIRHVSWSDGLLSAGIWKRRIGIEVAGRRLGVIGCGAIGRTVADLALGIGMTVTGHDPFVANALRSDRFRYGSIADLLASADVITLHCPLLERPLIDADFLARAREGVVIINTARAELVDTDAMLSALNAGKVSCYATDVHHREPPEPGPLLRHDRVIVTPHIGGFTRESVERASIEAAANLLAVLEGR